MPEQVATSDTRLTQRIQRKRTKGWRMPEGAVYVGRPTRWGNPFPISGSWIVWAAVAAGFRADAAGRRAAALAYYRHWLTGKADPGPLILDDSGGIIEFEGGHKASVAEHARGIATMAAVMFRDEVTLPTPPTIADVRAALAGRDLACFCPLDQPCHGDVLLELANRPTEAFP